MVIVDQTGTVLLVNSQTEKLFGYPREELLGQIVVAWNAQEKRLLVSRLIRFDHTDALVSDQREYQTVALSPESHWRIVGPVLWWTGRPR